MNIRNYWHEYGWRGLTLFGAIVLMAFIVVKIATAQTVTAQNVLLTFTAQTTTGNGSVVPVLTWATTPAATSCVASGNWTGTKAASGTLTLAAISTSATYALTCTWPNDTLVVSWVPATKNTDNTNYIDPKLVRVYWGTATNPAANKKDVPVPATTATLTGLTPNTYLISGASVNNADTESDKSAPLSVTITNATANKSVAISVNPVPNPPTNVTVT